MDKKTHIYTIYIFLYIYICIRINEHIDEQKASPHERSSDRKNREKKKEGKNDAVRIGRDDLIILQLMVADDDELLEQRIEKEGEIVQARKREKKKRKYDES